MLSTSYTQHSQAAVLSPLDVVNMETLIDEDPGHVFWAIVALYEGTTPYGRIYDAQDAIYWLQVTNHLSANVIYEDPDRFLSVLISRERSRAEGRAA